MFVHGRGNANTARLEKGTRVAFVAADRYEIFVGNEQKNSRLGETFFLAREHKQFRVDCWNDDAHVVVCADAEKRVRIARFRDARHAKAAVGDLRRRRHFRTQLRREYFPLREYSVQLRAKFTQQGNTLSRR